MDRNASSGVDFAEDWLSLSARRAWIEIAVDSASGTLSDVALRKESVDRNSSGAKADSVSQVALRKESVDRNDVIRPAIDVFLASLSARRAWIEIAMTSQISVSTVVALRKESVDRNLFLRDVSLNYKVALRKESVDRNPYLLRQFGRAFWSLSARRAWIEIIDDLEPSSTRICRSPQGERG